jgi:hypothetical protein
LPPGQVFAQQETIIGQAKNWIYPRIGTTKLKDFNATDADKFFKELKIEHRSEKQWS